MDTESGHEVIANGCHEMDTPRRRFINGLDLPKRKHINSHALFPWTNSAFEKWANRFVHKNHWRIIHICPSEEDARQIAALLFVECLHRYGDTINEPSWVMALFTRIVINYWHRLAVLDTRERDMMLPSDPENIPEQTELAMASLIDVLVSLPAELRQVMDILLNAPAEVIDLLIEGKSEKSDNQIIRRFCGIKTDMNIIESIRRILSGKISRHIALSDPP